MMQIIQNLIHRVQHVIGVGRTSTAVTDSGVIRTVQALLGANQVKDNIPVMQHYGFASNPPANSDVAVLSINGDRSVAQIIGSNHQSYGIRNMGNGSVALYDMFGNTVVLSSTGISLTDLTGNSVNMTAAGIKVHGKTCYEWDVNGYGQKITWTGGSNWTIDNYTTGATVTTNTHAISPPGPP
jgi:phage gp45-like